jgi:uncharacterized protein
MKRWLATLLILTGNTLFAQKDPSGTWQGKADVGMELRIVFHFVKTATGYTATMDSPDQQAFGIPCDKVAVTGDSVFISIKTIGFNYRGLLANDTLISGEFKQGALVLPLDLYRNAAAVVSGRPQTPKPPFNYNSEEVEYDNADRSVHFGATFTYPKTGSNFPAVLLITGSGQQDRDESILGHKPFAVIADYLTSNGYAVLRVDDRGKGLTKGAFLKATSADFANDAEASLAWLMSRAEVNKKKIGLIGHSEGAMIASIVAARNKNVNFVIFLAGPGVRGDSLLIAQSAAVLRSEGVSATAVDAYMPLYKNLIKAVVSAKDTAIAYSRVWPLVHDWRAKEPAAAKEFGLDTEAGAKAIVDNLVGGFSEAWMQYFLQFDPAPFIKKFNCKVLALNGEKDIQVIPQQNLPAIEAALKKSKSPAYKTQQLPGLNHLFQQCTVCSTGEYGKLQQSFAPEALQSMKTWLDANVQAP